jgi:hypothetical protein
VLFDGSHEDFPDLFRLIVAAPAGLSDLAALEVALLAMSESAPDLEMPHKMTQLLVRAAASSSVVRGRRMANGDKIASVVAGALARRRGEATPSLATVTLAEAAMRMFHLASRTGPRLPRKTWFPSSCAASRPCERWPGIPPG